MAVESFIPVDIVDRAHEKALRYARMAAFGAHLVVAHRVDLVSIVRVRRVHTERGKNRRPPDPYSPHKCALLCVRACVCKRVPALRTSVNRACGNVSEDVRTTIRTGG